VIGDVNKYSNNFMAEQLVRTLGVHGGASGDWVGGRPVVENFLKTKVGIDGFRYINGSGLFGKTAFSARDMVSILRYMLAQPTQPEYVASLAINGVDGTLKGRLKGLKPGTVRAKTGTLNGVVCLSGYLEFADGSPGLFSILMNELPGQAWAIYKAQDAMVEAIVGSRPKKSQKN
jgi:D-alanyl-D-alanine carboxypeptidase/D-alanyl-D-alanine-endopeptidase (penicillin-binding protein 4)